MPISLDVRAELESLSVRPTKLRAAYTKRVGGEFGVRPFRV
jgi:hypothetical protein